MSNRANASRYDGSPSVRGGGGGGGADLFGIQAKRQKDMAQFQQALELERMQKAHELDSQDEQQKSDLTQSENAQRSDLGNKDYAFRAGIDIAKQNNIIPANMPEDAIPADIRKQINDLGSAHIALQQKIVDNPAFQNASVTGATALQTKPTLENNEIAARARQISAVTAPPNTGVNYWPQGNPNQPSATAQGATQKITTAGGMTDPKTGQVIGDKPVETYGQARFPVDQYVKGDALTNNVQTKPEPFNIVGGGLSSSAPFGSPSSNLFNIPPSSSGVQTKPSAVDDSSLIRMMLQYKQMQQMQPGNMTRTY